MNSSVIRKIAWIHVEDRALLCVRSKGKELFYIPGGKPEPGESDEDALIREISEELGVRIEDATIEHGGTFSAPADGRPGLTVTVDAYRARHAGSFAPDHEIVEYRFLSGPEAEKVSAVTRAIIQHLQEGNVID